MSEAPTTGPPAEAERAEVVRVLAAQRDVTELLAMLSEPSWFVRRAVVQALGALAEVADLALIECLQTRRYLDRLEIIASDLSPAALERARAGTFGLLFQDAAVGDRRFDGRAASDHTAAVGVLTR